MPLDIGANFSSSPNPSPIDGLLHLFFTARPDFGHDRQKILVPIDQDVYHDDKVMFALASIFKNLFKIVRANCANAR